MSYTTRRANARAGHVGSLAVSALPTIKLKRAYDPPARGDGLRVLVDRLWPRGVKKEDLRLDAWAKELAPSTELRKWFGHGPQRWVEFKKRYRAELKKDHTGEVIRNLLAGKPVSAITRSVPTNAQSPTRYFRRSNCGSPSARSGRE